MERIGPAQPLLKTKSTGSEHSILDDFSDRNSDGVIGGKLTWKYENLQTGSYSFSLRNQLRENVRNVYVFRDFLRYSRRPT